MKKGILILVLLLVPGVGGCFLWNRGGEEADAAPRLSGHADTRSVSLSFRVGGRLASVAVDEGATVVPGELVASLDAEPCELALQQAENMPPLLQAAALADPLYYIMQVTRGIFLRGYTLADFLPTSRPWAPLPW